MSNLPYLALNALLVCIAIAFLWIALKNGLFFIRFLYQATKHPFGVLKKPNHLERVVYISSIEHKKNSSQDATVKTIPLTQLTEKKNWSSYDVPTFIRKKIVIH